MDKEIATTALTRYQARMRRVLDHVDANPDGDLSAEALAGVAAFSKHHFQRQFAALFGVSLGRYVRLVRLKRAAWRLAFRTDPILQIALDSGYDGPEAFARAFKQEIGQTPSDFRRRADWPAAEAACAVVNIARNTVMPDRLSLDQVRIVDHPATAVALLEHRGDPGLLGDTIRRFIAWRRQNGLPPRLSATYNLFHTDVDAEEFRLTLCAATDRPVPTNTDGVTVGEIPGGRCAVLRVVGGSDDLRPAVVFLYGQWLPASGEELRDFPIFVQRLRFFPDVPENEAVTDVFLPLRT